jgi:hypothetical protein
MAKTCTSIEHHNINTKTLGGIYKTLSSQLPTLLLSLPYKSVVEWYFLNVTGYNLAKCWSDYGCNANCVLEG